MDPISDFFSIEVVEFADMALLLMRWLLAFIFIYSFSNNRKDVVGYASKNGLSMPIAYTLVYAELVGAISLALGIFTQIGALIIMAVMGGAIFLHTVKWKSPYWANKGGWEYDLMIFIMAAVILTTGGGQYAIYPLPSIGWFPFS